MPKRKSAKSNNVSSQVSVPRWAAVVVVGLVAVLGIYFIYNTFAYQTNSNLSEKLTLEPVNAIAYCNSSNVCFSDVVHDTAEKAVLIRKSEDTNCVTGIQWQLKMNSENLDWQCLQPVGD